MATNQTIGIAAASVTINDFTVLAQIRSELKATKKMVWKCLRMSAFDT